MPIYTTIRKPSRKCWAYWKILPMPGGKSAQTITRRRTNIMDQHQYLVNEYQLILTLSEQMLTLAKDEKWDELVELEVSYLKAVEATTTLPLSEETSMSIQAAIRQSLRRILDNETQIKTLLQARMNTLTELIGQSVKQQEVNSTYGRFTDRAIALREQQ